jgi:starch synthase (maltosyl-transferring)
MKRTNARRGANAQGRLGVAGPPPPPRVAIQAVTPETDCGRFPIKRIVGDDVVVRADIFAEGHDALAGMLRYRRSGDRDWQEVRLRPLGNDRWEAAFQVTSIGRYEYTVVAWVDEFATWRSALAKKVEAGHDVHSELLEGAAHIRDAARRAPEPDARWLQVRASAVGGAGDPGERTTAALAPDLLACMARFPDRSRATAYPRVLPVVVDRQRARFGAWYEMFPRSCAPEPGRHGTFKDCEARVPYIASMGFDVLYLPPIHPIGMTHRKGPNNAPSLGPTDPGSPWAIGGAAGGHTAVHPDLGTLADFDSLVAAAKGYGIEIALDIAFQCSPDHPWVAEHPEWFRWRPDGSVQYAENPPKKYQDIYPLHFEGPAWRALWEELKQVVLFWVQHGVTIFRVDNPHTKPFAFWEWLIAEVQAEYPEAIFLAEAFTRPAVMHRLAKLGFTQSYTYFTWRNTKEELTEYFTELAHGPGREYMRPNLFANTPDILHEYLQFGGRAGFQTRLLLAATLGATYGIYGPGFERSDGRAIPGTEEYADSEKYQIRFWGPDPPDGLHDFIARVNQIRRDNPAMHGDWSLRFVPVDNPMLITYVKLTPDRSNIVLVIVNLDPHHAQSGWITVPLEALDLDPVQPYQVHELLSDARYLWSGATNYVALDPRVVSGHIFRLRRRIRSERDFDYFM